MACCLFGSDQLSDPMVEFCSFVPCCMTAPSHHLNLSIELHGIHYNEVSTKFRTFSLKIFRSKISSSWSRPFCSGLNVLIHWGRVTHICVSKLTIIGSDNDLSPGRRQAIIWANARILLIGPLGTNFSELIIEIYIFSLRKMHLKMSSGKRRPSCLGLNVLINVDTCVFSKPNMLWIRLVLVICIDI